MSISLRLGILIVSLFIFIIVISTLKKDRMPIKYSISWLLSALVILLVALFPGLFVWISKILGFVEMSNMVIGMFIFILIIINISLTVIISGQEKKITLLIQEISLLKENVKDEK